ncbi:AimR family lysis-lysogeny pheromone receptor [Gracilibacillus sp. YIM 98692]|uniref:AimR family lysis-lysogeny pheromone receptor n=1 Tax=Gracilibacillus sp. YIM 98692 TaxID=2663532 RepID=UPI0013D0C5BA|nr:AimR family lysis-lysogeny pheromone receptor [Gracilibacillus sp. YIM 98692]
MVNKKQSVHNIVNQFMQSKIELPLYVLYQQINMDPQEVDAMRVACLATKSDESQRVAMEYLYSHGLLKDLQVLIDRNKKSDNFLNRKWAEVYQLFYNRRTFSKKSAKPGSPNQYLQQVQRMKIDNDEHSLQILHDLMHIYCYFDMHQYRYIGTYNDRIKERLLDLNDPLLYKLLQSRLNETLIIYHWKRNELILSRKYGYRLLEETNNLRKKMDVHNILAQGYLFESYDQAINHVHIAIDIAKELENERALFGLTNYTLPFISSYHCKTDGIETTDKAEQAHLSLAKGDVQTCIAILEAFEELTPFQQYYLGLARQDKHLLRRSYQRFIEERDDYFYAKLPLEALHAFEQ